MERFSNLGSLKGRSATWHKPVPIDWSSTYNADVTKRHRVRFWIFSILGVLVISVVGFVLRSAHGESYVGTWSGGSYPAPDAPYPNTLRIRSDGAYEYLQARGRWHQERDTLV
jgi:hypothetical protein